jgi:arsenite methyltransferase
MNPEELKLIVKEKYGAIAKGVEPLNQESGCCQTDDCCSSLDYTMLSESYENLEGYHPDADLNLGCGIPTQFAGINKGDSVLDLGSGAGNDCFVARALAGETGKVTGLDFTDEMIEKAHTNLKKLAYTNVFFIKGDIENMPVEDNTYDVVLSNCVLNLVPDKQRAFSEIFRVLKPGGHFCVSDVVIHGALPEKLRNDAEFYAGCISGAMEHDAYIEIIKTNGFKDIEIHKLKQTPLPEELLANCLTKEEKKEYQNSKAGIYNITVTAHKK